VAITRRKRSDDGVGEGRSTKAQGALVSLAPPSSLHARLVARDEHALAELIDATAPWLLGVTQSLLSDPDEAEEVVQETYTIVWNRVGQVPSDPGELLAWVLRVGRNRAIDRLRSGRRQRRKSARFVAQGDESHSAVEAVEPNEAGTPGWHVHTSVHAALASLPPEQQIVVRLAYFHGLTQSAIAKHLEIPVGTVKTRLRLAFDKLRPQLASIQDWIL